MEEMNDLMRVRHEKLQKIENKGYEAFGRRFVPSTTMAAIKENYQEGQSQEVSIAGRIMTWRGHGKVAFFDMKDRTGSVQVYAKKDIVGESTFELLKEHDIGDIVGVKGEVFKTRTGEITVQIKKYELLAKSLRPLPEKWHGLTDIETRYRQRYVDLIINPDVMSVFVKRSAIIKTIRDILDEKGFLEVETPMMHSIPGGAVARPFKTHHNALGMDLYLRIATELFCFF